MNKKTLVLAIGILTTLAGLLAPAQAASFIVRRTATNVSKKYALISAEKYAHIGARSKAKRYGISEYTCESSHRTILETPLEITVEWKLACEGEQENN